ncbi:MAG: DUF1080 domain-containing protein [Verrucomicrobiota bacterium]
MKRSRLTAIAMLTALVSAVSAEPSTESPHHELEKGWVDLFPKGIEGWETYLGPPHHSVDLPGIGKGRRGEERKPVGLNKDPKKVFNFIEFEGKPTLYITGEIFGAITTLAEYENYHISLRVKWGKKKWPPRAHLLRDSGLLIHCFGEHGETSGFWMNSVECQVQETDCGDLWLLGTAAEVPHTTRVEKVNGESKEIRTYNKDAEPAPGIRHVEHGPSEEDLTGWNTVEVYTLGATSVFVVNGQPNMAVFNSRRKDNEAPVTKGRIQLQSEGAEVYYQDVKLRPISAFPDHLEPYLKPLAAKP